MTEEKLICIYDRYLKKTKTYVSVICTILEILLTIFGIAIIASGRGNGWLIFAGICTIAFGSIGVYIFYFLSMAVVGFAFDVKYIRNKLYGIDNQDLTNANEEVNPEKVGTCEVCGKRDANVVYHKIVNENGVFYRWLCADCAKKSQAKFEKE